jgi:hypothetical protein
MKLNIAASAQRRRWFQSEKISQTFSQPFRNQRMSINDAVKCFLITEDKIRNRTRNQIAGGRTSSA